MKLLKKKIEGIWCSGRGEKFINDEIDKLEDKSQSRFESNSQSRKKII